MVVGTLSLVQKGQTNGFSGCSHTVDTVHSGCSGCSRIVVYGGGDIVFDTKRSNRGCSGQNMQYTVHSRFVVYGGGDIVFHAKRSNQRMQWTQYAVCSMQWNSGIWLWGHCLWYKKVKPVDAVCSGHSGIVVYGCGDIVFGAKRPKTMSPPPYTTIPLRTTSTASSGLTFLHQRQCPHHHIPVCHCVLHPLPPLV